MKKSLCISVVLSLVITQLTGCAFIPEKKVKQTVTSSGGEFVIDTSLADDYVSDDPYAGDYEIDISEVENTFPNIVYQDGLVDLMFDPFLFENKTMEQLFPDLISADVELTTMEDGTIKARMTQETYFNILVRIDEFAKAKENELGKNLAKYQIEGNYPNVALEILESDYNDGLMEQFYEYGLYQMYGLFLVGTKQDSISLQLVICDINNPNTSFETRTMSIYDWINAH